MGGVGGAQGGASFLQGLPGGTGASFSSELQNFFNINAGGASGGAGGDRGKSKHWQERAANTLDARLLMKLDELTVNSNEKNIANTVLVIDGKILTILLKPENVKAFIEVAIQAPAIVCCRCTPTQKAEIVQAIRRHGGEDKRTLAIGDGGNDVSMIKQANVGIGIRGKEGQQASLAADYSVENFYALRRLLLWHGRNNFQRS